MIDRFDSTLLICLVVYALLVSELYKDHFKVSETLSAIFGTLKEEQQVKLLMIMEMNWLNLAQHDV